jgi:hypothetical protein
MIVAIDLDHLKNIDNFHWMKKIGKDFLLVKFLIFGNLLP